VKHSQQKALNEYLFHELGVEGDDTRVSETWPFALREIGEIAGHPIFEFDDDGPYYAFVHPALNFLPKSGMSLPDLVLQDLGARWIGARDPISLEMSMPGVVSVPGGLERRRALEELGAGTHPRGPVEILEGLFLRRDGRYLGVFLFPESGEVVVAGIPDSPPIPVPFPDASAWRRLAWGVGSWLQSAKNI
jgi:hypothetical protein